ncbi:MAG: bifunctional riboflavin kinase/FAD synthetase [Clostridia bacterium]|nr:bifunctional riboflavin kinase/FAD synthetase [Clostridia bacterium]
MDKEKYATAVALGYFDGIHKGHKAVLQKALDVAKEKGLTPAVLIFSEHPKKVLKGTVPPMLTDEEMKSRLLREMGFTLFEFDFRKNMDMEPYDFAHKILIDELGARAVVCGYDYRYGKKGCGSAETLRLDLEGEGVEVFSLEGIKQGEDIISASKIRQLISGGDMLRANEMLGRVFSYNRIVERGDALGRKLGFPTINQSFPEDFILPKFGVYASVTRLGEKEYPSVTNIGVRPTVGGTAVRSETCILGFSGDLYGKNAEVGLLSFLRGEMKFTSLEELSAAVKKDMEKARLVYNGLVEKNYGTP